MCLLSLEVAEGEDSMQRVHNTGAMSAVREAIAAAARPAALAGTGRGRMD